MRSLHVLPMFSSVPVLLAPTFVIGELVGSSNLMLGRSICANYVCIYQYLFKSVG